nr:flagellar basal body-associated protein FliL [Escherichia albertii]
MKQSLTTQIHFAQSDDANDSALSTSAKSLTSLVAKARTNAEVISTPSPAVTIVSPLISSHQTQPHLTASAPVLSAPLGSHEWQQTLSQHISLFTRQGQQRAAPSPVFYALDTFTVNLGDADRVLYIGITLRLKDEATRSRLSEYLPEVRSRLLLLFSRQDAAVLATELGKQQLIATIKTTLSTPLVAGQPKQDVTDVLYTAFILR